MIIFLKVFIPFFVAVVSGVVAIDISSIFKPDYDSSDFVYGLCQVGRYGIPIGVIIIFVIIFSTYNGPISGVVYLAGAILTMVISIIFRKQYDR